jgi:hypothetical protein
MPGYIKPPSNQYIYSSSTVDGARIMTAASDYGIKNRVINGDFSIWQRGTSFSNVAGYTADRWQFSWGGTSTSNITRQDLPIGSIPGGNESSYFARYTRTTTVGDDYFLQRVEDVRTLLGKTVTFSFWAKANVATTISQVYGATWYGSGGSSGVGFGNFSGISIGTTWAKYSFTATVESGIGKTVGTNNFTELVFKFATAMGNIVVDIWGVQLEVGNTSTNFEQRPQQVELAMCQRYFQSSFPIGVAPQTNYAPGMVFVQTANNSIFGGMPFPVPMRTTPSFITYNPYAVNSSWRAYGTNTDVALSSISANGNMGISFITPVNTSAVTTSNAVHGHWAASAEL